MEAKLLTVTDICRMVHCSRQKYYDLRRRGLAPASLKVGKQRLHTPAAASEWLASLEKRPEDRDADK